MTSPAAIFRASYSDWKLIRTRKCVQIIFEVPLEGGLAHAAYAALGGMPDPAAEAWVAIARLNPETVKEVMPDTPANQRANPNDKTQSREEVMPTDNRPNQRSVDMLPASGPDIPARAHKPVAVEKRLAQRAGILCADPQFQQFLRTYYNRQIEDEKDAAFILRQICNVESRADIRPDTEAGKIFDTLYARFITWRDADKYVEASA